MPRSTAAPRRTRRPAARPEELIEAALAVFGERGYKATTLEEVARRAGVSKGTVYLYFDSKEALFRAVVLTKAGGLLTAGEEALRDPHRSARALLTHAIDRMWDAFANDQFICLSRMVQGELTQFPEVQRFYWDEVIVPSRRLLVRIAERGVATGEFRPEAVVMIPRMVPPLVKYLHSFRFQFGHFDVDAPAPDTLRRLMTDFVMDGIAALPKD